MADRFRGFLPVVVDVETGGFNAKTDALLEIAAVLIEFDDEGTIDVWFVPIRPGNFDFWIDGYENRGLAGTFEVR